MGGPLLLALLVGVVSAAAQGTAYVPVLDPAYDDLGAVVSAGLLPEALLGERPFSEAAFGRFVAEADARSREQAPSLRVVEALDRLRVRFASGRDGPDVTSVHPTEARLDLAVARSPDRAYRSGSNSKIEGSVNPLLQRNQGRVLVDGATAALEAGLGLEHGRLAMAVTPRVYVGLPRGPDGATGAVDVQTAYVRGVAGPVALDVGRLGVVWGYGVEGGTTLSTNPRGLDMVRLAAERPVRLPGPLRALGLWEGSISLVDLGRDREFPGAKMVATRVSGRPGRYLEVGVNYLNIQGGEGAPEASFSDRIKDFLLLWRREPDPGDIYGLFEISDKVVGVDLKVSLPAARSALYVNFLTTDDRNFFSQPSHGYWEDAVWLVGAEVMGLGAEGRTDLHFEWRHAGARVHTHHQFTSGVTTDGRVLGDALGPNAVGLSARLDWTGRDSRVRVTGAWERYSGDLFLWDPRPGPEWSTAWYRVADNPDEIRTRVVADYLRFVGWGGFETSLRLGYEHVTRFDYTDTDRHNLLGQASLRYRW